MIATSRLQRLFLFSLIITSQTIVLRAQQPASGLAATKSVGHAHNDYLHERPLLDALEHGFSSFEADVFLVDNQLLIGHFRSQLTAKRTLESLYLEPLRRHLKAGSSGDSQVLGPFTLLIDLKTDGEETYQRLHQVLAGYADILTEVHDGQVTQRVVDVVISGNRPTKLIAGQSKRWAGIDGRLGDLDLDTPSHLLPLISDHWGKHFTWRGNGPFPAEQRERLHEWTERAHAKGRRVRFWATPESPALWQELYDANVDLINTDDLAGLASFLRELEKEQATVRAKDAVTTSGK